MKISRRHLEKIISIFMDFSFIILAYFIAFYIRYKFENVTMSEVLDIYISFFPRILLSSFIYVFIFSLFEQYNNIWSVAGIDEYMHCILSIGISCVISFCISFINSGDRLPIMVTFITGFLSMILCEGLRIIYQFILRSTSKGKNDKGEHKRVLIYGAGKAASIVIKEYRGRNSKRKVVALIDDNERKIGTYISGIKVIGSSNNIDEIINKYSIDEVIIAIANISAEKIKRVLDICGSVQAQVKIMPGIPEMIDGYFSVSKIREVDLGDLLGREAVNLDFGGIFNYLQDRVVLVTGGGGSIGSELCRQIVKFKPKQLIILDIYENNAYDIQNELLRENHSLNLEVIIASVRDRLRLKVIFEKYNPDVIFHAAAHKHVPLMEENPGEAIKNNVVGTLNMAELASQFNTKKFVLISTDKAVNPTNVMGASKRICEMIVQGINKISNTEFVSVRFGNVLGSNGSVIPLFKKQISKGGPVTLTHKEVTRFFMTIGEAAQLVLQAGAYAKGGEIFVLDMGEPVKIYDLAVKLIKLSGFEPYKDIEIKVIGLRPGEKLYEEILMNEEELKETKNKKIFIGKPGVFNIEEIKEQINELIYVIDIDNNNLLKSKLKEIVKTYKDPEEVNELVLK